MTETHIALMLWRKLTFWMRRILPSFVHGQPMIEAPRFYIGTAIMWTYDKWNALSYKIYMCIQSTKFRREYRVGVNTGWKQYYLFIQFYLLFDLDIWIWINSFLDIHISKHIKVHISFINLSSVLVVWCKCSNQ